jgi:hypothetical protein
MCILQVNLNVIPILDMFKYLWLVFLILCPKIEIILTKFFRKSLCNMHICYADASVVSAHVHAVVSYSVLSAPCALPWPCSLHSLGEMALSRFLTYSSSQFQQQYYSLILPLLGQYCPRIKTSLITT